MSLYVLRIDGGIFDCNALYKELGKASVTYVLSRNRYDNFSKIDAQEVVKYVQNRFVEASLNDGEGGELLLYCLLEAHLKAPKILSKMEIKTAKNDYIKGADGIHLLDLGANRYHLIFGESKMIGDGKKKGSSLTNAVYRAFESLQKVQQQGFMAEIELVNSELMKEAFDKDTADKIGDILLPSARAKLKKENAFGIFVGFEIDINDWDIINLTSEQVENRLKTEVHQRVEAAYDHIKKQIVSRGLQGYHFYIYAIPFIKNETTDIDKVRHEIISSI